MAAGAFSTSKIVRLGSAVKSKLSIVADILACNLDARLAARVISCDARSDATHVCYGLDMSGRGAVKDLAACRATLARLRGLLPGMR